MRILLAEDNAANRMIARSILEREGHAVTCAVNGIEAMDRVRECVPDIVLLDILMPVMDGMRTARHMRQLIGDDVPIIALTGYDSPGDVGRVMEAGFDGLISKPLQPGDLSKVLGTLRGGSRAVLAKTRRSVDAGEGVPLLNWRIIADGPGAAPVELAERILARYRRTLWDAIAELRATLDGCLRADPDCIARFRDALHRMKGSSDMIGLARAPFIAGQLRNAPPSELREGVRTLLQAITDSLPVLHHVLLCSPERRAELLAFGQGGALVQMGGQHQAEAAHHDQDHRAAI